MGDSTVQDMPIVVIDISDEEVLDQAMALQKDIAQLLNAQVTTLSLTAIAVAFGHFAHQSSELRRLMLAVLEEPN